MKQITVIVLLMTLQQTFCDIEPICMPNMTPYVGPPIPILPDRFVATMELTTSGVNMTAQIKEYYDYQRNIAVNVVSSISLTSKSIKDYNRRKSILIQGLETTMPVCSVSDLVMSEQQRLVDWSSSDDGGHLTHTADMLVFNKSYPIEYRGTRFMRGIRCNYWTLCLNNANSSSLLHYYFAVDGWEMPTAEQRASLVHIRVVGDLATGLVDANGKLEIRKMDTNITYFSFKQQTPPDSAFQIPNGVYCPELKSNLSLPKLPDNFYTGVEYYSPIENVHHVMKIYYDFRHGLIRTDTESSSLGSDYEILDYKSGVAYSIKHSKNDKDQAASCSTRSISKGDRGSLKSNSTQQHYVMKTAMEELVLSTSVYAYQGTGNVRGREVEVWVSQHNSSQIFGGKMSIAEWSFLKTTRFPVQLVLYDKNNRQQKTVISYFSFDKMETAEFSLMPLKYCYEKNKQEIQFDLSNPFPQGISSATRDHAIKMALARNAGVPLLRVATTQVFMSSAKLNIVTTIFGPVSVSGVISGKWAIQLTLKDAVKNLQKSIQSGGFNVVVNQSGILYQAVADRSSFSVGSSSATPTPEVVHEGMTGTTIGIVATIVILISMAIVIGIYLFLRRRGINLFEYKRYQGDDGNKENPNFRL